MNVHVTITYSQGNTSSVLMLKTDLFCPYCGKQEVWDEEDEGDYYVGTEKICIACEGSFYMKDGTGGDGRDEQVISQIKKAITAPQSV